MHKYKVGDMVEIVNHWSHPDEVLRHVGKEAEITALLHEERLFCRNGMMDASAYGPIYSLTTVDGVRITACEQMVRLIPPPETKLTDEQTQALWDELRWRPSLPVATPRTHDEPMHTDAHLRNLLSHNLVRLHAYLIRRRSVLAASRAEGKC